ncbi:four-carbon acid sugar kinase family protein [Pelagibacterium xiamenense]|uniref:four-carbon acid sugar kinase family protein n=1 Tax=Pelagibacterium xiamenense TaxID=2901140 RepID=UPI001E59326E|nr:four-carbon acid sugar kinase family protein [Pelagibacterium xiamenense]MCD7059710.1 four-carbon acid sugar kinase family protein [Pelagibacterium xiamenense]
MLLAIVADDLTGALDAAAPFAGRGLRTAVAVTIDHLDQALAHRPDVVAVNTASREIPPDEARRRVVRVLDALPQNARLFKKIDSRLKGNLEAELSAFGAVRFAVLPGIPEFGRTVIDGKLTGFGVAEPIEIARKLGAAASRSDIPDTPSAEAMREAVLGRPETAVLVGARGLAAALAQSMTGAVSRQVTNLGRKLVMVIGSRDPITLAQIDVLVQRHADLQYLAAPNGKLATDTTPADARLTILQAVPGEAVAAEQDVALALAQSLNQKCFEGYDGALISGGATAETVLGALGIGVLDVLGEIVDGLPVSRAGGLTVISKSGGFGAADALAEVARRYGAAVPGTV